MNLHIINSNITGDAVNDYEFNRDESTCTLFYDTKKIVTDFKTDMKYLLCKIHNI